MLLYLDALKKIVKNESEVYHSSCWSILQGLSENHYEIFCCKTDYDKIVSGFSQFLLFYENFGEEF
jgi:hypothetical protein